MEHASRKKCADYFGMLFAGEFESPGGTRCVVSQFPWRAWGLIGRRKRIGKDAALVGRTAKDTIKIVEVQTSSRNLEA